MSQGKKLLLAFLPSLACHWTQAGSKPPLPNWAAKQLESTGNTGTAPSLLQSSLVSCQRTGSDTNSALRSARRAGNLLSVTPCQLRRGKPAGRGAAQCNICARRRQLTPGTARFVTQLRS